MTDRLNEAERLKPICTRAAELGVTEPDLTKACKAYFGGATEAAEKENAQLAQEAASAAAGFAEAESKAREAAADLASGAVESGREKMGEALAIAEETTKEANEEETEETEETEAVEETATGQDHGQQALANDDDGKHRYGGIEFGIGIGFTYDLGNNNRIVDAVEVGADRIVRVQTDTDSFNIGVGVFYDLRAKILGEGIVLNEPLPADETGIRYRTTSQSGLLVLSSYSF